MKLKILLSVVVLSGCVMEVAWGAEVGAIVSLLEPSYKSEVSVEEAIYKRRSVRDFSDEALTPLEISQVLWAAGGVTVDGVTGPTRAYPSAGAIYPQEIYLVAGKVEKLDPGIYRYDWRKHSLELLKKGDIRAALAKAAYGQSMVQDAPATIVVTAFGAKVADRYGDRGASLFVPMDTGHMGQNVHLQAQSLGLGTVMMAGFVDNDVSGVIGTREGESPLYLMPIGHPRS